MYDFDDAVHEHFLGNPHRFVRAMLQSKVPQSIRDSSGVMSGNGILRQYFDEFVDSNSILVPSAIDTTKVRPDKDRAPSGNRPFVFGWIGTPVTFKTYVEHLVPEFESVAEKIGAEFWVIGAGSPRESTDRVKFHTWSRETERDLLNSLDVGIMPLVDDPWSRGKCGYKLLQYMAVGKAVIASPVGVNQEIILDGETGYLARETLDWGHYLTILESDRQLSKTMGQKGLKRVTSKYSIESTGPTIVDYFNQVLRSEVA